jgi:hypothetical protein
VISEPEIRACTGMVSVLVVPRTVSAPVSDTCISAPDAASAGSATGDDSTNVALGNCELSRPSDWIWLSRICWSLVSDCTLTVNVAARTDSAVADPVTVTLPVISEVRPTASLGAWTKASCSRTR